MNWHNTRKIRRFGWKKKVTVIVLKFQTLVALQKVLDKECRPRSDCFWRSSLIEVFPFCYYDKQYVNPSLENQHFIWEQKEKSDQNVWIFTISKVIIEPVHEISNTEVCATSKASDQPAHTRSLIRAFTSRLSNLWLLSYWLNTIWSFYA